MPSEWFTIQNATPWTVYCEYCGHKDRPGASHECDMLYEEQREEDDDAE